MIGVESGLHPPHPCLGCGAAWTELQSGLYSEIQKVFGEVEKV